MIPRFERFAAADWSGAKGARHKGIAVAICGVGEEAPMLVPPPGGICSRQAVLGWLRARAGHAALWHPPALTATTAATEGWTFGVA